MPRTRTVVFAMAMLLGARSASANDGTAIMYAPFFSVLTGAVPKVGLHVPPAGGAFVGTTLRVAPVTFYAMSRSGPEVVFVPQLDLDVIEGNDWATTRVRFVPNVRTIFFPAGGSNSMLGIFGVPLDLGGSVGFGGPSYVVGTGLVVGGKVGTLGVVWRRAHGAEGNYHAVTLDFTVSYPFALHKID